MSQVAGPGAGFSLDPNLNFAAQQALSLLGQNQLDNGLHGGGLVGKSMDDVTELLGAPNDERVVAGQTLWDYMPPVAPSDAEYAVVFHGNTVTKVANAGS